MPPHAYRPRLIGDGWNRDHLTKHAVAPEEAEDVIAGDPVIASSYKGHLVWTGPTAVGRMLTVVAGPVPDDPGAYDVYSARPASRRERTSDRQQRGGSPP